MIIINYSISINAIPLRNPHRKKRDHIVSKALVDIRIRPSKFFGDYSVLQVFKIIPYNKELGQGFSTPVAEQNIVVHRPAAVGHEEHCEVCILATNRPKTLLVVRYYGETIGCKQLQVDVSKNRVVDLDCTAFLPVGDGDYRNK